MIFSTPSLLRARRQQVNFDYFPQVAKLRNDMIPIVTKTGTPVFINDRSILINRYESLKHALSTRWHDSIIAYSFKTNYAVAKSNTFKRLGTWAEVVSAKEYEIARRLGYKGVNIIFNGPAKGDHELEAAMRLDSLIHIDNADEFTRVLRLSKKMRRHVRVGVRLSMAIGTKRSRFGFSIDSGEAETVIRRIQSSETLDLVSLHMHIGTDIDTPSEYYKAACTVASVGVLVKELQFIDMGGGFPAHGLPPYGKRLWFPQDIDVYVRAITQGLSSVSWKRKPILIVEPGRYLVDDAEVFIVRIVNIVINDGVQYITCDGTVTMLPLTYYRPQIVQRYEKSLAHVRTEELMNTCLYGASCSESDILYRGILPCGEKDDYLLFFSVGAYNQSMGSEFMLEKPQAIVSYER